jgi:DNA-binding protein YbaB
MPIPLPDPHSLRSAVLGLQSALSSFENARSDERYSGSSADGTVTVQLDGMMRVVSLVIAPSQLSIGAQALADKVKDTVNGVIDDAETATRSLVSTFASALSLPGLPAYGSAPPDYADFAFMIDRVAADVLANNPCTSTKNYECQKGNVIAVVNARRRVLSLTFLEPLPRLAEHLATRAREAINCADDKAKDRPGEEPLDPIVGSPGLHQLVLYAKGLLKLNDRVQVKTSNCTDWATVGNAGLVETNIGVETDVGNILSRAKVVVRDRGRVHGFIRTSDVLETQNLTEIDGPVVENTPVVLPDLALNVQFPSTSQGTIEPEPDQQRSAGPGYYNKLHAKSRSQVFLSSGVYYLNEFIVEPDARVWLNQTNGPVIIYVKNTFIFRGAILDSASGFPRLFMGYVGTSLAVVERVFRGTLSAPNAKINIATVTETYEGAFHGKDIEVFPDAKICHRRFELRYDELPSLVPPSGPPAPVVDLGFENVAGWSSPQALLASVPNPVTQGSRSLKISNVTGMTDVVSASFSSALAVQGATRLLIDLWLPSSQPNPTYFGNLTAMISIPSAGIVALKLGALGLTSLGQNQFNTLEYALPANVRTALDGSHTDVSLRLVLCVNSGSGPWYIDNVRFAVPAVPVPPPSLDPTLSFEDLTRWSSPQVALSTSTSFKTHLQRSLRFPVMNGWTQAISLPFSTATVTASQGKARIDLRAPSSQPNQWWHGQLVLSFSIPSLGIQDAQTSPVELTPLAKEVFNSIELTLPTNVRDAINGSHPDLIVKVTLNVPAGAQAHYVDNLRFL